MRTGKRILGDFGEQEAKMFLVKQGYSILDVNYSKPYGEIDIVARLGQMLHFVEVKTSTYFRETSFTPEMRINRRKVRNLKKICETYLFDKKFPKDQEWQIDVISVILNEDNSVFKIDFIENAVFDEIY